MDMVWMEHDTISKSLSIKLSSELWTLKPRSDALSFVEIIHHQTLAKNMASCHLSDVY